MSFIEDILFSRVDKLKTAIKRIRSFDPLATGIMDTPYYVAYSGGSDENFISYESGCDPLAA